MKILVATNAEECRTRLCRDVTGWGHQIVVARDGEEAWHLLQEPHGPRVALLDEALPKLTGAAVCRRLRRRRIAPIRYLILLTAGCAGQQMAAALEAGADDCIRLPYREDELRARICVGVRLVKKHQLLDRRLSS